MPRLPRLHVSGGCYHVILRGNHREDLFGTAHDRHQLNQIVAEALTKYGARLFAFCWMSNHLHALVQIGEPPLGKLMQRIAMRYSRYRHKQLGTTGHLFERRHRAWLVETDAYFITLLRYIHLNPVSAGMVKAAEEYPWSSHRAYLGVEVLPWLTLDFGLGVLGPTVESSRRCYRMLMAEELYASEERVLESSHPDDRRVLGSDDFLSSLPTPRVKRKSRLTLAALADQVCIQRSVTVNSVQSPSRLPHLVQARAEIAQRAVDERVASMREVARFLNRWPSAICQLLKRRA